jgi:hypothetical protein
LVVEGVPAWRCPDALHGRPGRWERARLLFAIGRPTGPAALALAVFGAALDLA